MQKRGLSQIDWVMSLAFFSIFLMLFFMFINSRVSMPIRSDTLVNNAETAFLNDVTWQVQKTPVFTQFANNGSVITQFEAENGANYYLGGKCFAIDENRLFYVSSGQDVNYLISNNESNETYTECNESLDLTSDKTEATTKDAGFTFEDSLLSRASYNENMRIYEMNYAPQYNNHTYYSNKMLAKYTASSSDTTHKTYVLANSTGINTYVDSTKYNSSVRINKVEFTSKIYPYKNVYVYNGAVNKYSNITGCSIFSNTTFIDLYDSSEGLAFQFENAKVTLCYDQNITLSVNITDFDKTQYQIFFHEGDYNDAIKLSKTSTAIVGMTKTLKGMSQAKLDNVKNTSEIDLKSNYSFPIAKGLAYEIYRNDVLNFSYENISKAPTTDIFVKGKRTNILDKYGNQVGVQLFSKIW